MRPVIVALLLFAIADLVACGLLLLVVWVEYRRQRRQAEEAGQPVPKAATGQFLLLGAIALVGIVALYAAIAFLLEE
jgi:uncharacterized membrane protein